MKFLPLIALTLLLVGCTHAPKSIDVDVEVAPSEDVEVVVPSEEGQVAEEEKDDDRWMACTKEYMPVCAELVVQCIRAPCPAIKQTYGNKCMAESEGARILYEGECRQDEDVE